MYSGSTFCLVFLLIGANISRIITRFSLSKGRILLRWYRLTCDSPRLAPSGFAIAEIPALDQPKPVTAAAAGRREGAENGKPVRDIQRENLLPGEVLEDGEDCADRASVGADENRRTCDYRRNDV